MVWGILSALDEELRLIVEQMQVERTVEAYGTTFHVGTIGKQQVIAAVCSVGTINAAVCASTIIRELGATAVINVGVAGGMVKDLNILDVVIGDEVIFHDVQHEILVKYYPFQRAYVCDEQLRALAVRAIERMEGRSFGYREGRIATGDTFVESTVLKEIIATDVDPLCVEMEGAAIAQVAFMSGVPFLVIRAISDDAENDADLSFDEFLEAAARNGAEILLGMLNLAQQ